MEKIQLLSELMLILSTAAKGGKDTFTKSGQLCLCGSRIPVDAKIYDEFIPLLIDAVNPTMKVETRLE